MKATFPWGGALLGSALAVSLASACTHCYHCYPVARVPAPVAPSLCNTPPFFICGSDQPHWNVYPCGRPYNGLHQPEFVGQMLMAKKLCIPYPFGPDGKRVQNPAPPPPMPYGPGPSSPFAPGCAAHPMGMPMTMSPYGPTDQPNYPHGMPQGPMLPPQIAYGPQPHGPNPYGAPPGAMASPGFAPGYPAPMFMPPGYGQPAYGPPGYPPPGYPTGPAKPQGPLVQVMPDYYGVQLAQAMTPPVPNYVQPYAMGAAPMYPGYAPPYQGYVPNMPAPGFGPNYPRLPNLPAYSYTPNLPAPPGNLPAPGISLNLPSPSGNLPAPSYTPNLPVPGYAPNLPMPSYTPNLPNFSIPMYGSPTRVQTAFPYHPYVRSPRDFFMWRENMEDQARRETRPSLVP